MRAFELFGCVALLSACFSGKCEGGIRALLPIEPSLSAATGRLSINLDTGLHAGDDVVAASGLGSDNVLLEGPNGRVPLTVAGRVNPSAHSCASAGSLVVTTPPLAPGDYTFIVVLDRVKWPALSDDDVVTWEGHLALMRRYHVR